MVLLQYFVGFFLSMVPLSWLRLAFSVRGQPPARFYFSGRVALFRLARSLRPVATRVLIPDYICNILHRSFSDAGFKLITYRTNELFEPSVDEIRNLVGSMEGPKVLCLVPIFGAEGGQRWITSPEGRQWRKENQVTLIFDCCQDISRLWSQDFKSEEDFALISSFNDKSFPGVMGAVAITDINDTEYKTANLLESSRIFFLLVVKSFRLTFSLIKKNLKSEKREKVRYDYSFCSLFPYDLDHSGSTKIQVGVGAAGLLFRGWYLRRKSGYLFKKLVSPISTPYFMTSSYILSNDQPQSPLKVKLPYAKPDNPLNSLRPSIKSYHFKGYQDF